MLIFALYIVPALIAPASPGTQAADRWELATADTRATICVVQNQIHITQLENPDARHNWVDSGKDIPVMAKTIPLMAKVWIGQQEQPTAWTFDRGESDADAGTLTLTFTNREPKLLLRSVWRARPGRGPIEHWLQIQNQSDQRIAVSHQDSLALRLLSPAAPAKVWWIKRGAANASKQGGTFTEPVTPALNLNLPSNCEDGASPVPWMAIQVGDRHGLYVGWEFSGLGRISAIAGKDGEGIEVDIGLNLNFRTDVEPGETFLVPPAFVGCYAGDIDDGSYTLHRFVLDKLRPSVPDDYPDPSLNYAIYLDAGGPTNAKTADLLRVAGLAHDLGFEAFMPDAMWFPACGDWRWDPARFPEGITPIADYVHRNGMKMALWCAWTNGGISEHPDALSVRGPAGHPDWFSADFPPNWKPGPFAGGQICLACPEARQWAIKKTQWLVGHHGLDYLKHDCGPIVNHCNKTTHRHHYGVDASYWATMGYYDVQEKLRKAYPRVVLENCSGAGHIKDFGVVSRTHYTATTDTLSNLPDRQSFYDSTFALPPLVLQAYTYDIIHKAVGDEPGPFFWRSAMMGAWQIAPAESAKWTDEQKASARRAAEIYKQWVRPILKDVKVHHILPRPDGAHWDGMFYWSPSLNRGTLYIFRPDAPQTDKAIKLKGLGPRKEYWAWCEDGSIKPGVRTGKALMDEGLAVTLPQKYTSDLIYLQDASLGKPAGMDNRR